MSEKLGPAGSIYPAGSPPPSNRIPGPLWIPYDQFGNPLSEAPTSPYTHSAVGSQVDDASAFLNPRPAPRAAPGTLPEPMDANLEDASRSATDVSMATTGRSTPPPLPSHTSHTSDPFPPDERIPFHSVEHLGSEGLDDPSTFSPMRSTHGLDDPNSFSPARGVSNE
ncbi:hypothetical protein P7C70_g6814, partial [Phenoliferia sp. Uapishka_3]